MASTGCVDWRLNYGEREVVRPIVAKLRIAYLAPLIEVPEDFAGGQGGTRHVMEVAEHLAERIDDVTVFIAGRGRRQRLATINGVSYHREFRGRIGSAPVQPVFGLSDNTSLLVRSKMFARRLGSRGIRRIDSIRDARRLVRMMIANPPDAIYERTSLYSTAGIRVARRLGIPFVAEVNDLAQNFQVLEQADAIVIPEPTSLPAEFQSKSLRLQWGVNILGFSIGVESVNSPNCTSDRQKLLIVFLGSFLPWHGAESVVKLAYDLKDQLPEARYLMIGDGPDRARVERYALTLGISELFDFRGMVSTKDVAGLLRRADIGLAPYGPALGKQTGRAAMATPLKILEYMAVGLPVVVSKVGNESGIIEDTVDGSVFDTGDDVGLKNAVLEYALDTDLRTRTGENARKKMVEKYSWSEHTDELTKLFTRLVGSTKHMREQ